MNKKYMVVCFDDLEIVTSFAGSLNEDDIDRPEWEPNTPITFELDQWTEASSLCQEYRSEALSEEIWEVVEVDIDNPEELAYYTMGKAEGVRAA